MSRYKAQIIDTCTVLKTYEYIVEADSEEEAYRKIAEEEFVSELVINEEQVDRDFYDYGPIEII